VDSSVTQEAWSTQVSPVRRDGIVQLDLFLQRLNLVSLVTTVHQILQIKRFVLKEPSKRTIYKLVVSMPLRDSIVLIKV
jgi:hypothetical protein